MSNRDVGWRLVADVGGTNVRFALAEHRSTDLSLVATYAVADFPEFYVALQRFLDDTARLRGAVLPDTACLAVASPVTGDSIRFTNSGWSIERGRVATLLGGAAVKLINDFAAVGYGITALGSADWRQFGGSEARPGWPVAVLGPGTGLGACSVIPANGGYTVVEGEGGHADFAPVDAGEIAVLEELSSRFGRVSIERVLSGDGILNVYRALAATEGVVPAHQSPAAITASALAGADGLSVATMGMFCRVLGAVAGNMALHIGALGGVYIAGGIAPRILPLLEASDFRHRFEAKGRYRQYMAPIPLRVVVKDNLGLLGALRYLGREDY